ncbi:aryl-sulfate sulfotransferase, partial [Oligoflexia bacterium]|nr:aryl-sulfate sulfotransferase [Oligoflexia bacterium]
MINKFTAPAVAHLFLPLTIFAFALISLLHFSSCSPADQNSATATVTPTPTTNSQYLSIYDPKRASGGLTLYPVVGNAEVQLLDMRGKVVHRWNVDAERARLLPNGHLLVIYGSKWGRNKKPWKDLRNTIAEYDWDGAVVWKYEAADEVHHDLWRLPNGNTIFLRRTMVPAAFRQKIKDPVRRVANVRADSVIEVTPEGKVAWQWNAHEHLDLNDCGRRGCGFLRGTAPDSVRSTDWTHTNTAFVIPDNRWFDAGDTRFRPGNVIVFPRSWWTTLVIDRDTKEVVWRYGGDYKGGLGGGHETHIIEKGLPGAGNMLIFDNGSKAHPNESFALEINPVTKKIVWLYEDKNFYSIRRGSLQRLPNGNTFISECLSGRAFEVTPDKQIVWEYKSPFPI